MAERHAEITWAKLISDTPVVVGSGSSGKTLLPGHIRSYLAANNITVNAERVIDELGGQGVLPAEPAEIQSIGGVERWHGEEVIQDRRDANGDVAMGHPVLPLPNDPAHWPGLH